MTLKPHKESFQRVRSIKQEQVKMRTENSSIGFVIMEVHDDSIRTDMTAILEKAIFKK